MALSTEQAPLHNIEQLLPSISGIFVEEELGQLLWYWSHGHLCGCPCDMPLKSLDWQWQSLERFCGKIIQSSTIHIYPCVLSTCSIIQTSCSKTIEAPQESLSHYATCISITSQWFLFWGLFHIKQFQRTLPSILAIFLLTWYSYPQWSNELPPCYLFFFILQNTWQAWISITIRFSKLVVAITAITFCHWCAGNINKHSAVREPGLDESTPLPSCHNLPLHH